MFDQILMQGSYNSMKIEEKPRENWQMHENKIAPLYRNHFTL